MQADAKKKQKQRKKQYNHGPISRRSKVEIAMRAIEYFTQENEELNDVLNKSKAFFKRLCQDAAFGTTADSGAVTCWLDCAKAYVQDAKLKLLTGITPLDAPADCSLSSQDDRASQDTTNLEDEAELIQSSLEVYRTQLAAALASLALPDTTRPTSELQEIRVKIKSAEQLRNSVKKQKETFHEKLQKNELYTDYTAFLKSKACQRVLGSALEVKAKIESIRSQNAHLAAERDRPGSDDHMLELNSKEARFSEELRGLLGEKTEGLRRARRETLNLRENLAEIKLRPLTNSIKNCQSSIEQSLEERQTLLVEIRQLQEKRGKLLENRHENQGKISELKTQIKHKVGPYSA